MDTQPAERVRAQVDVILESKVEEFHLLGYDAVTRDDIWECVTTTYKQKWPHIHQIVNDIFSLKPTTLMNWLTMNAFRGEIDSGKNSLL